MSNRQDRVAQLELPPGQLARIVNFLKKTEVLSRIAIALVGAAVMWLATSSWNPPFPFRIGKIPARSIIARVSFTRDDDIKTKEEREAARRKAEYVFEHDSTKLTTLFDELNRKIERIADQTSTPGDVWNAFALTSEDMKSESSDSESVVLKSASEQFEEFKKALTEDEDTQKLVKASLANVQGRFSNGLLEDLEHESADGNDSKITVLKPNGERATHVEVADVQLAAARNKLPSVLQQELSNERLSRHIAKWLTSRLPITLKKNDLETLKSQDAAAMAVETVTVPYEAGNGILADGGVPLDAEHIALLRHEHNAYINSRPWKNVLARSIAALGMFVALYMLCGVFLFYRDRELLIDMRKFLSLQCLAVVTIILCRICVRDQWQAEILPLLMFGMTATLAYRQEVTLLLSAAMSLVCVMSFGLGVADFVVFAATMASIVLLLRDVRSRTKLIYIGLAAAVVAFLTSLGAGIVSGELLAPPLLASSAWSAFLAVLSGMLITGLLPFIEKLFEVQTEISLLELGDVAHPLLQELVRRAPGTYNHSINVASIAEAAAKSIGANGLLLRVGAYFHDIGKMLKPQYFVENQGTESNRHEDLLPAMSTLIIIAHVKDGADLARQHHLPKPLIDLIQQHHGTTLVEYFFNRANKQSEDDPDASQVDEGSYRYPGPKPQTREAAVLMLADAVESASRSLTEPAPARIEGLVHDIATKKLMDGQFDECGLTLRELHLVEDSLVKSLTAVYHGRVKYPDQQSA